MFQEILQPIIGLTTLLVGVTTYILNARRERAIRRAELVRTYTSEFSVNEALTTLFTDIDYSRFRFIEDTEKWLGQKPEQKVVLLLDLFNSIGHNWHRKVLTLEDVRGTTLGYAILRAYRDDDIQRYMRFVDQWDADHLGTGVAFEYFRKIAVALDERSAKTGTRDGRQTRLDSTSRARDGREPP
jgi:hypothetical protein